jgi:hypothetical protein
VGFIVKKELKSNILNLNAISDRVVSLHIKITNYTLSIIQVYAPTEKAPEEEIEKFYKDIRCALDNALSHVILLGDFNAKIGQPKSNEGSVMGPWGYGTRNKRGGLLMDFCHENELYILNSHFKKNNKTKWTWMSPDGKTKNEIDYFITRKKDIHFVNNVEVINTTHPTDPRLVRATWVLNTKPQKSRSHFRKTNTGFLPIEKESLKNIFSEQAETIPNTGNIQATYTEVINKIDESLNKLPRIQKTKRLDYIITDRVRNLIIKRTLLKEKSNKTKQDRKEIKRLYSKIRKNIKRNKNYYNYQLLEEELSKRRSVKRGYKRMNEAKQWIPALKNKTGGSTTNRHTIIQIATDFYQNLYSEKQRLAEPLLTQESKQIDENVPTLLESELRHAIESLKTMKSPGDDNLTNDVIKALNEPLTPILTHCSMKL